MQTFDSRYKNAKRPARTGTLVTAGRIEDVPAGRGATIELEDGTELALFNTKDCFYAVENFCPHRGAPLADAQICGATVECDWHGWRFDLATGQCPGRPAESIETYEVRIEDGWIKILV